MQRARWLHLSVCALARIAVLRVCIPQDPTLKTPRQRDNLPAGRLGHTSLINLRAGSSSWLQVALLHVLWVVGPCVWHGVQRRSAGRVEKRTSEPASSTSRRFADSLRTPLARAS